MKVFKFISLIITGFLPGALSHKYNPLHQESVEFIKRHILKKSIKFEVVSYKHGDFIFFDRNYTESLHPKELENTFLVKTNRHAGGILHLTVKNEVTLHRLISPKNNNQGYFDWLISDCKTRVDGTGIDHEILISKVFKTGSYRLSMGGPFSADPIFISAKDSNFIEHFSILN